MDKPVNPFQGTIDSLKNPWNLGVHTIHIIGHLIFIVLGISYAINPSEYQSIGFALGMINVTQLLWLIPTVGLYVRYRRDLWEWKNQ